MGAALLLVVMDAREGSSSRCWSQLQLEMVCCVIEDKSVPSDLADTSTGGLLSGYTFEYVAMKFLAQSVMVDLLRSRH